jgi:hypothetical protein
MSSTKNPENEAENPAPARQHSKMAPRKDAPPGLEQDGHGDTIPVSQRTKDDQEKARTGRRDS